ncbi:MAG: hypothetical protein ACTSRB_05405 [Candidatus Helarchaeota archaeon]
MPAVRPASSACARRPESRQETSRRLPPPERLRADSQETCRLADPEMQPRSHEKRVGTRRIINVQLFIGFRALVNYCFINL